MLVGFIKFYFMKKYVKYTIVKFQLAMVFLECIFFIICFPFLILFFDVIKITNYIDYLIEKIDEKVEDSSKHSLW